MESHRGFKGMRNASLLTAPERWLPFITNFDQRLRIDMIRHSNPMCLLKKREETL